MREAVHRSTLRKYACKTVPKVPKRGQSTPRYLLKLQTEVDAMQQLGPSFDAVSLKVRLPQPAGLGCWWDMHCRWDRHGPLARAPGWVFSSHRSHAQSKAHLCMGTGAEMAQRLRPVQFFPCASRALWTAHWVA